VRLTKIKFLSVRLIVIKKFNRTAALKETKRNDPANVDVNLDVDSPQRQITNKSVFSFLRLLTT